MQDLNKIMLSGRLTRDPQIFQGGGDSSVAIARFSLAVNRAKADQPADFINCIMFGKGAEFAEKYYKKGTRIIITGRLQTGKYEKDGQTVYTTDVVVEDSCFAESKKADSGSAKPSTPSDEDSDGFMPVEDLDEELPFA